MLQKNILAVILARGGSKGIPKKNIYPIDGHPLISYTIFAGLNCNLINDLVVSTDSDEIASVARHYGAQVPFMRPSSLAGDTVWSRDALKHAVLASENFFKKKYDYIIELPCVAPMRDKEDIEGAIKKLMSNESDSVISVCQMQDKHPVRMKRIVNDQLRDFCQEFPEGEGSRRQDLEPCFIRNGAIYLMRRKTIVDNFSRNGKISRPYIMPEEKSVNIDTMMDLKLAEILIKENKCNNKPMELITNG